MEHRARQHRLALALDERKLDAFLVTHQVNIRYLCGFTGSSAVLAVAGERAAFFTDGRYTAQAREQVRGAPVRTMPGNPLAAAAAWLKTKRVRRVGVEAEHMTLVQRGALSALLPGRTRLRPATGLVERLRAVKDKDEVRHIRAAVNLAAALFGPILKRIRPGKRELEVAAYLEFGARKLGASGMAFETIVASGRRSALPHGVASSQPITSKGFIVLDFGVILAGYCSDMTRTVHVGRPGAWARSVYQAVLDAQQAALAAVGPGVATGEVDQTARKVLARSGLGRYFTHSTGHGVGLEIHETPRIAKGLKDALLPGMVVTVEPGVYVPGRGGVRIEDMVLVTEKGREVLTSTPKELITLAG
ncbi:MAG: Xaa-Pro peptidase family protein [Acidobacteria bacterium]|nr:Xaa-Pro peptidase family protein [Acidobacteriota bacterium]